MLFKLLRRGIIALIFIYLINGESDLALKCVVILAFVEILDIIVKRYKKGLINVATRRTTKLPKMR